MYSIGNYQKGKPSKMGRDYTIGFVKANIYALFLFIPVLFIYMLLYGAVHGLPTMGDDFGIYFSAPFVFLISLVIGTIFHELIHAVCWSWLDDIPWSDIHFGFKWKTLTPYVHCPEPIEVNNYRWGVAMPGLVLGVFPYILALVFQNGWLFGFGFLFTAAAGGDIIMLWLLRDVKKGELVQDHPNLIGCQVINPNETTVSNE